MKSIHTALAASLMAGGLLAATAFSLYAAEDASAQGVPSGEHWHHHGGGMWRVYGKLNLSDQQKESMKSIMTSARPQMKALHDEMRANEDKLLQATPGSASYDAVVAEVSRSNATLASQRTTENAQLRAQMYAVLTPEQRTQLATLQAPPR